MNTDGSSSVLSEQFRDFQNDASLFGISHFDASGNLTANWILPEAVLGGYGAEMAQVASSGVFAVRGIQSHEREVVRTFSAEGRTGTAWAMRYGTGGLIADPETGSVLAWNADGLAVISPDGTSCNVHPVTYPSGSPGSAVLAASGGHVYQVVGTTLVRIALP